MSTLEQVQLIFRDIFDDESLTISPSTSSKDIDDWDSLTHIQLVFKIEKAFKIRFSIAEVTRLKNIQDLITLIDSKRV